MNVFRVQHTDMMGFTIKEEFFDSKNKAKKALKRMFKDLKSSMAVKDDLSHLSKPVVHCKQPNINGKSERSYELLFEIWHKCSYEYDEWDTQVEGLCIDRIKVN